MLVLKDGAPAFRRSYSMDELEAGIAASPKTNYRLASFSKQFTAASVLLLAEDGALKVDDPLRRWLPSLPAAADGITLRHLLSHTSGLIDYEDLLPADQVRQVQDADAVSYTHLDVYKRQEPGMATCAARHRLALVEDEIRHEPAMPRLFVDIQCAEALQ